MSEPTWYEIYFTDFYEDQSQVNWIHIGTSPNEPSLTAQSFNWELPPFIYSDKCRIGIQLRNHRGIRSEMIVSSIDFLIRKKALVSPILISPVSGSVYRFFVPIIFDHTILIGTASQRSFYQLSYRSDNLGIDWTRIQDRILVGSDPIQWDVRDFMLSDDYVIRAVLFSDNGSRSIPTTIDRIKIAPLNYFLVDTVPPKGSITIQDNPEFTNKKSIIVSIKSFDETTGVKSIKIQQRNITDDNPVLLDPYNTDPYLTSTSEEGTDNVVIEGADEPLSEIKTWTIQGKDGLKHIEAKFKDFGGNEPSETIKEYSFRTFLSNSNIPVDSFLIFFDINNNPVLYTMFGGSEPSLWVNKIKVSSLSGNGTAMMQFKSVVYFGIKTKENKGILQNWKNNSINSVHEFSDIDSVISSLNVFNNILYIGLENGSLYSFNGSIVLVKNFNVPILNLFSDKNILIIEFVNSTKIETYNGLTFFTVSPSNGRIQI